MTFEEFMVDWQDYLLRNPGQRQGQSLYNYLWKVDPNLAEALVDEGLDPFFDDEAVPEALQFLQEQW